jgi:hypothetical protein
MIKYEKIIMIRIKDNIKYVYFINYLLTLDQMKLIMKYSIIVSFFFLLAFEFLEKQIDICILFCNAKEKRNQGLDISRSKSKL